MLQKVDAHVQRGQSGFHIFCRNNQENILHPNMGSTRQGGTKSGSKKSAVRNVGFGGAGLYHLKGSEDDRTSVHTVQIHSM